MKYIVPALMILAGIAIVVMVLGFIPFVAAISGVQ